MCSLVPLQLPLQPASKLTVAVSNTSFAHLIVLTLPVAVREFWTEAILWMALGILNLKAMKITAGFRHLYVTGMNLFTTTTMLIRQSFALYPNLIAAICIALVLSSAAPKTVLREAIEALLVLLVLLHERILNAFHKHVTDGMQSSLDVVIELPTRLADGLMSKSLHEGLHRGDVALPYGIHEVTCCSQ
jgi:hypothetical protein